MTSPSSTIIAHTLSKRFGRFLAADSLDFEIPQGSVVGFLGPNGAGKTTTIRMLAGVLTPTSGTITIDGLNVAQDRKAARRRIGYLPESAPLYTEMRVEEFLKFRAKIFELDRSKRREAIARTIDRCNLSEVRRRPIFQLSRGYRQRVGLAAAILHEPKILLLDEPTVGLDPAQILETRKLIRDLAGHHTILFSTHILPEVELTCDRIMMIARGRIRARGTIEELRQSAKHSNRIIVETKTSGAEEWIRSLQGVSKVEHASIDQTWNRLCVTVSNGVTDVREPIANELAKLGAVVRELRQEAPTLEHLFVQMIADAEAEAATRSEVHA